MKWRKIALPAAVLAGIAALGAGAALDWPHVRPAPLNAAEADKPKAPDDKDREADRQAVGDSAKELVKRFERGDGKALADLWTEEGEYVSDDGTTLRGRAAIEDAYGQFFKKNPDLKLDLTVESIRFLSRDGAVVEGVARTQKGGKAGEPTSSRFSTLYARENGKWLIALMREWPDEGVALRDLDWLIGSWEAKVGDRDVQTTYEWDEGKHFIRGRYTVKDNGVAVSGTQLIGKDPRSGQLHSWLFEGDGGFGDAAWTWDGKQWRLEAAGVEPDGGETTATNLLTPLDKDSFTWQSIDRTLDGAAVPDIPPIKVVRAK